MKVMKCMDCGYEFEIPKPKHKFFQPQCNRCGSKHLKWIRGEEDV